jgi:hypothetical protein
LLLLLLLLLLLGWWLWPNGRLAKARELQAELFAENSGLSPEDRRAKFEQLRNVTRQLSDSQRRELGRGMMDRRTEQLRRYVQMSPADRRTQLDRDIQRQEQFRQRRQDNPPPNGGGGNGRPSTPEDRERWRQQMLDNTTPEYRELRDQYRRDMAQRRQELGLPPAPPRPPRG